MASSLRRGIGSSTIPNGPRNYSTDLMAADEVASLATTVAVNALDCGLLTVEMSAVAILYAAGKRSC